MRNPQFILNLAAKLVIVLFAGAGGSCTGIEKAIGRHVDYAINHNDNALSCHRANHPQTHHLIESVWAVDPRKLAAGRVVGYMHFSPDCTHFSQARGGQPRSSAIRSLPWVTVKWCGTVRPEVFTLENVKEIRKWGPLIAKRDKATGRVVKFDGTVAAVGERVRVQDQFLIPDPKRQGKTWRKFLAILRGMGYDVEDRVLCAADYDVPQQRNRLFVIGHCDGRPIVWPEPVRAKEPEKVARAMRGNDGKPVKPLPKWRAGHECIDWSIRGRSIFGRKKPLAPSTMKRIARGMEKFVLNHVDPFIVPVTHTTSGDRVRSIRDPLPAITTAKGGELAVVAPILMPVTHHDESNRARDLRDAMPTLTAAHRGELMLATAFITKFRGESPGSSIDEPVHTITGGGNMARPAGAAHAMALSTANLVQLRNHCDGRDLREPLKVVSAGGLHHALVEYRLSAEDEEGALRCAAFIMEYYSQGGQWSDLRNPINTVTTKDRLALVTVWVKGDPYVIVDICIRMLTPRELATASSLPPQYILSHGHDGRTFTKSQQVFFIGNCVPPELQYHVTAANFSDEPEMELQAA